VQCRVCVSHLRAKRNTILRQKFELFGFGFGGALIKRDMPGTA
jgi:hypothetical protein